MDVVNFDGINKIVYSINSSDGATNYENSTNTLSEWIKDGNVYIYTTGFVPEKGNYSYTIQYYKDKDLKGSTLGYFTK